ncbi:MAG: type II toxin-antitoxin system Phd/YefM family antitoxin [Rhodospirillaceae bacterium]|nr:type II toxin-antitoxin system Phd/YefM family antitoxin [Rhodospirillaceae bacterium]
MARVSATALQKQFGKWAEKAIKEPVAIERHGREVLYLISADQFHQMQSLEREALYAWELSEEEIRAVEKAEYGKRL